MWWGWGGGWRNRTPLAPALIYIGPCGWQQHFAEVHKCLVFVLTERTLWVSIWFSRVRGVGKGGAFASEPWVTLARARVGVRELDQDNFRARKFVFGRVRFVASIFSTRQPFVFRHCSCCRRFAVVDLLPLRHPT